MIRAKIRNLSYSAPLTASTNRTIVAAHIDIARTGKDMPTYCFR